MTAVVRLVIAVALVAVLGAIASPWLHDAWYVVRLVAEQPPATLPVPVQGVPRHVLRDSWGAPRANGRRHAGVDIFARRGTPVVSATRGLVWRIGENRLGGNVVWVLGPGGQLHYYAHLDRFADIRRRQRVEPGDVIGFVGNSGNAERTPPHLHYGIYGRVGGALNPYPLLRAPAAGRGGPAAEASG